MISEYLKTAVQQFKASAPYLPVLYLGLVSLLFLISMVSMKFSVPVAFFMRDTAVVLDGNPFAGFASNIGIIFWCTTAAVCLFSAAVSRQQVAKPVQTRFLLFAGLLSLMLLIDDFFLIHDKVFPVYLNIPETAAYAVYMLLILVFLFQFRRHILKTEYFLLLLACGFFASSILSDMVMAQDGWQTLLEDGLKLIGIATWCFYFLRTSLHQILNQGSGN